METNHNGVEELLNEYDISRLTKMSVASVRRWRLLREGPRYLKLGSSVRYRREDVLSWLASRPGGGESSETR